VSRADRVAARVAEQGLDALLVSDRANVRYLTGFTGSAGYAIVGTDVRRFITDFRYIERARTEVPDFDRELAPPGPWAALADGWAPEAFRLGFDDDDLSVRSHGRLAGVLPDQVELVAANGLVEAERAVKEPGELERIRAAAELADDVYDWLFAQGVVGRTEREVAFLLEHEMRRRGAEDPSFPSIVASGEHGALPHAEPRDVPIPRDSLVTLDIGARLDGYCSDCTRTWATGTLPGDLAEAYALVLRAQLSSLAAIRPGPEGREIDAVARDLIDAAGHGEHFGHGLGHGVGLEVHEAPRLSRLGDARLTAANVVTVEPGVYLPGRGGVRIEDLVVVTEDGCDVISRTTKELVTVG
jgi:Xaa-Pro aminopeptidase